MDLKKELQKVFENTLKNSGTIESISSDLTNVYKQLNENSIDTYGNKIDGVDYDIIKNGIIAQINLSFNTRTFLSFNLIEGALILGCSKSILVNDAIVLIPPPGFASVINASFISGIGALETPLNTLSKTNEIIVNKYFNVFSKHNKNLTFLYNGLAPNGSPITINSKGLNII